MVLFCLSTQINRYTTTHKHTQTQMCTSTHIHARAHSIIYTHGIHTHTKKHTDTKSLRRNTKMHEIIHTNRQLNKRFLSHTQYFHFLPPQIFYLSAPPSSLHPLLSTLKFYLLQPTPSTSISHIRIILICSGDAEAEIRKAFRVARQASPCVLFLDELDALVTNRYVTLSHKRRLPLPLAISLTHTLSLTHTFSLTHTHSHTQTHIHSRSLSFLFPIT